MVSIVEMDPESLKTKQEVKEEDEVCFELIRVKEERVLSDSEQVENCLDMTDSQICFVADGIKEENEIKKEHSDETELNENTEFQEKEIHCDWFEPPLNEPDPLAFTEMQDTSEAPYSEAALSSSRSNSNGNLVMESSEDNFLNKSNNRKRKTDDESSDVSEGEFEVQKRIEENKEENEEERIKKNRKKELDRLRSKLYRERKRKRIEIKEEKEAEQIKKNRKKELARLRSKRYRERKRRKIADPMDKEAKILRRKELSKQYSKKYRDKKKIDNFNSIHNFRKYQVHQEENK